MHTWYESWQFNTKTLENSSKQENTYTYSAKKDLINVNKLIISWAQHMQTGFLSIGMILKLYSATCTYFDLSTETKSN
jgi:hypothetical protein